MQIPFTVGTRSHDAVRVELPGRDVVGEVELEDLLETGAQLRLEHRNQRLDAPVEVALHQVRRADEVAGHRGTGAPTPSTARCRRSPKR